MSKYINAGKLLAKIEWLKSINIRITCEANKNYCRGYADAIEDILHTIASLQHEQPEVDLEKEIYKLYDGEYHDTEDVARHFYELGLNARKEGAK